MDYFQAISFLVLLLLAWGFAAQIQQPNLVFILADDFVIRIQDGMMSVSMVPNKYQLQTWMPWLFQVSFYKTTM